MKFNYFDHFISFEMNNIIFKIKLEINYLNIIYYFLNKNVK